MKKFSSWFWIGVLLASLTSCGLLERHVRVVGEITSFGEQDAITVPATVEQGKPFDVTVITAGGGCTEQGQTVVEVQGLQASVTPYDYEIIPIGRGCTLIGQNYPHTATLNFAEKGTATITFHGRKMTANGATATTEARTLEVR